MARGMIALAALASMVTACLAQTPAPPPASAPVAAPAPPAPSIEAMQKKLNDWPQLERYRDADDALPSASGGEKRVVFYGDSITDAWARKSEEFFPGKGYIESRNQRSDDTADAGTVPAGRRASQTRRRRHPGRHQRHCGKHRAIHAADDRGQLRIDGRDCEGKQYQDGDLLDPSADHYSWHPGIQPADQIREMNTRLKALCQRDGLIYLDYYTSMTNAKGGLDPELAKDGVHPTSKGYAMMSPLAEKAIAEALAH